MTETENIELDSHRAPYEPDIKTSTLRYYINILRRRIWILVTVLVMFTTVGLVNVYRAPRLYRASSKILVEKTTPQIMKLDGMMRDSSWWDPDYYKTQEELLLSRAVMENALKSPAVVKMFKPADPASKDQMQTSFLGEIKKSILALLGATPGLPPEPWERLRGQVSVQHLVDTHFLMVKAQGTDPVRITTVVNSVTRAYQAFHLEKKQDMYDDAFTLLQKEKEKEEEALLKAEGALDAFRKTASVVSVSSSDDKQPVLENLARISEERTSAQLKRIDLTSQIAVVKKAMQADSTKNTTEEGFLSAVPFIRDDPVISRIRNKLSDTRKSKVDLSNTYGPAHPKIRSVNTEIDLLEDQYSEALDSITKTMFTELETIKHKEAELADQYEKQHKVALALSKELFEYTRLNSEVQRHRKLFDSLVDRIREVDVSSSFVKTNVEIVGKASVPSSPFSPNLSKTMTMSIFFGLFVGLGLAFLIENLDDTIKTPEDLKERLNVPLLGFVPEIQESKDPKDYKRRGIISLTEPVSSVAEAYRNIRTSIFYSVAKGDKKILSLTSCGPAEGKTTTSINLALSMASSGKKVLLVDGDFHRPMVARVFQFDPEIGLTNYLIGESSFEDSIQNFEYEEKLVDNLDIITSGPQTPNPADLLGSKKMKEFLDEARARYDWVIVDTPPLLFVSDSSILSALCDGVIFVVKSGKSNHSMLARIKDHLKGIDVHIIGSILNGMIVSQIGRYYSDYSYHGYSKYASDYHSTYYSEKSRKSDDKKKK